MTDITIRSVQAVPGEVLLIYIDMDTATPGTIDHLPREIARMFPGQSLIIMDSALQLDSVDERAMNGAGWYRAESIKRPPNPPLPPNATWRNRLFGGPVQTERSKLRHARYEGYMDAFNGRPFRSI